MLRIDLEQSFKSVGVIAAELNIDIRTVEEVAVGLDIVGRRLNSVNYLRECDVDRVAELVRPGRVSGSVAVGMPTIVL